MCKSVCPISFRCLLTVSYSLQSTWCTAPTSSPIKPLTVETQHCAILSSDKQCVQFAFVSTRKNIFIYSHCEMEFTWLSLFCFSGLGEVKHNQGPTNSEPDPPTSVQIIGDQPRQLYSINKNHWHRSIQSISNSCWELRNCWSGQDLSPVPISVVLVQHSELYFGFSF